EVHRIPPGFEFRSARDPSRAGAGREGPGMEDEIRVYLRDMAKSRLITRAEELELAHRIVSLRKRFQSALLKSRPALREALHLLAPRDDRQAPWDIGGPADRHRDPVQLKAMNRLVRLACRLRVLEAQQTHGSRRRSDRRVEWLVTAAIAPFKIVQLDPRELRKIYHRIERHAAPARPAKGKGRGRGRSSARRSSSTPARGLHHEIRAAARAYDAAVGLLASAN